ncbi:hypothetical protein M758_UG077300, partial [Ceratodon purpureus]
SGVLGARSLYPNTIAEAGLRSISPHTSVEAVLSEEQMPSSRTEVDEWQRPWSYLWNTTIDEVLQEFFFYTCMLLNCFPIIVINPI